MVTENNLTIEMSGHNSKEEAIPAQDPESLQEPEPPSRQVHGISWILAVLAILITPFLFALDNTITADIIPVIVKDFGGSNKLPWLSVAFMMGALTFVLPYGSFYTLFDTKKIYIGSLVVFTVGSALCGAAPNINAFIIGRVIAGVGGIGMYLGVMNLLSVNTSATERPLYLGLAIRYWHYCWTFSWWRAHGFEGYLALGLLFESLRYRPRKSSLYFPCSKF